MDTKAIIEKAKALRSFLHKIPERSFEEVKTKQTLMTFLKENTSFEEMADQPWVKDAMIAEGVPDEMLSESY